MSTFFEDRISPYIKALPPSGLAKFLDITNANPNIVPLSIGAPDFDIPDKVKEAEIASIKAGKSGYTSTMGLLELRQAISDNIEELFGVKYDPQSEIMVTVGVSEALYCAIRTITQVGDEILLPQPSYAANLNCIILAGCKPVYVQTKMEDNFIPTVEALEKAITPKTKAIMLGYPNNPTGAVLPAAKIKEIGDWACRHDIAIISDELYCRLTYGGKKHTMFTSFPEFRERTIVLNGFSKAYAMTGLRLGYMMAPAQLIEAANLLHQNVTLTANATAQYGAVAAMRDCEADVQKMVAEYDKRRHIMIDGFRNMGLPLYAPEGAFYVFPCIKNTGLSSMEFVEQLLQEEEVLVIPGNLFGEGGEGYIRCSYAYSEDILKEALKRISKFIKRKLVADTPNAPYC